MLRRSIDVGPTRGSASACEADRWLLESALHHGRTAMAIWQNVVFERGLTVPLADAARSTGGGHLAIS